MFSLVTVVSSQRFESDRSDRSGVAAQTQAYSTFRAVPPVGNAVATAGFLGERRAMALSCKRDAALIADESAARPLREGRGPAKMAISAGTQLQKQTGVRAKY